MEASLSARRELSQVAEPLVSSLELLDPEIRQWSRNYLRLHHRRYIHDLKMISAHHGGGAILEIGSLPCHLTWLLQQQGYDVVGLDIDPERARRFIDHHNLDVRKLNVETERLPFDDETFSLILFNEIFEHLRIDPIATLTEVRRVLRPGGTLILTTPNLYAIRYIARFLLGRGAGDEPYRQFEKLYSLGHMGHVRLYCAREVRLFLENCGFEQVQIEYRTFRDSADRMFSALANTVNRVVPRWRRTLVVTAARSAEDYATLDERRRSSLHLDD